MLYVIAAYIAFFLGFYRDTIGHRFGNVFFSIDCLLFSVCTLGNSYPFESFSSAAWRAEGRGDWYGYMRPVIDTLMWFDPEHCANAYRRAKLNLPEDMR